MAAFRAFHETMMQEMFDSDSMRSGDLNLSLHCVTQDATNSAIWQKRKLTALLLHTAYLVNLPPSGEFRWCWSEMFDELRSVADVQPVDDSSGKGSVALTTKMLHSLQCPTVHDLVLKHSKIRASRQKLQPPNLGV